MKNAKTLLGNGTIIVAALILAFFLAVLPQPAWADEGLDAEPAIVETESSAAVSVGDTNEIDAAGDAEQADEGMSSCYPEQASEASASKDLDASTEGSSSSAADEEEGAGADESADAAADAADQAQTVTAQEVQGYWVVSDPGNGYGLQRYWYVGDAYVVNRLITPDEGAGYYAYATAFGYVVRGKYTAADGTVYLADNDGKLEDSGWLVTAAYDGGFQRYYIDPEKHGAVPGASTAGYAHYTTSAGYVLRSVWDDGCGRVWLADNDGLLACGSEGGWLVTGEYTGGALQRYYIDSETRAAKTSYFTVEGSHYFGKGGVGYVLRGAGSGFNAESVWSSLYADNDGKLATSQWLCTDAFGQGLQRYWFDSTSAMAKSRLVNPTTELDEGSYCAYATADGYVLRGKWDNGCGRVYVADNDGLLASTGSGQTGWLVTDKYDGGYQRYYLDMDAHAACSGFFEVSGTGNDGKFYGLGGEGYVMRGKSTWGDYVMVADNDGKLRDTAGWYVGTDYDSEIQRYYFEQVPGIGDFYGAKTGEFTVDGNLYCGRSGQGYVYRNTLYASGGSIYRADNDGVLTFVSSIQITQDFRSIFYHGTKTAEYQKYIVIHDTEGNGSASSVIDWWAGNGNYIAAHFVINKDGSIVQCVPMDTIAHHAGWGDTGHNAYYGVYEDGRDDLVGRRASSSGTKDYGMNSYSIGIELVHVGGSGYYPEAQLKALDGLIAYIDAYYGFESQIIDHKMWRTGNSDTSSEFAGYLANYIDHRTHN